MGRIHLLDPLTVEQIRAGEVIERPASVVKELVENALDAGARTVSVRIRGGGIDEVMVQDDGEGMSPEDAALAVHRHATSKISHSADLFSLSTLGFRGEALASIAAVTHFELLTRVPTAIAGVRVKVVGGGPAEVVPAAAPPGTTVTARHLFFNTPPRRAFLKSATVEGNHVEEVLVGLALSRPAVRFRFTWDQREVFDVLPQERVAERVEALLGTEWAHGLIPLGTEEDDLVHEGIGVTGLIGLPHRHKNTRTGQYFFVNRRFVKSQPLSFALSRGYGELLPTGRFPVGVVFLTVPPHTVDVNVHPTKREVKFQDERAVLQTLVQRVRRALERADLFKTVIPTGVPPDLPASQPGTVPVSPAAPLRLVVKPPPFAVATTTVPTSQGGTAPQPGLWQRGEKTTFRVIGQSHELFVLVEAEGELWLIDQHAAHERIVYEQVLTALQSRGGESQPLLLPLTFELPPAARAAVEEMQEYLTILGFDLRPFGGSTYQLQATPPYLHPADTPALILELAQGWAEGRLDSSIEAKLQDLAARIACKVKAIKAGQALTLEAMQALVSSLLACRAPFVCPHGRPTMIRFALGQLAAHFDRR
ncbi:MAG: DNA mismatch repair endonuclease MutL [Candidatus Binatia bacterium]|nr:DNA mismatch repair endonuclease MutL [Candidatus Binatia bacterium]